MNKKKIAGIIIAGIGILVSMMSLGVFSVYWLLPIPGIAKIRVSLSSVFFGSSLFPPIMVPISGVIMLLFGLYSVFFGLGFFVHPINQFHIISIYPLLIFISGLLYIVSSIFLFRIEGWVRKLIITHSIILMLYFLTFSIYCIPDPEGWGKMAAFSIIPYILFPLFFIIFFTRPQIKGQFKHAGNIAVKEMDYERGRK